MGVGRQTIRRELHGGCRDTGYDEGEQRAIVGNVGCEYRDAMRWFARMNSMEVWYSRIDATEFQSRWHDEARKTERKKLKAPRREGTRQGPHAGFRPG